jgi:hypothetical protein
MMNGGWRSMHNYVVTVYPKNEDWQIVDVEADSKLQASVKAVNEVMGYEVYKEDKIIFDSIDDLNEDVPRLGIVCVGEVLLKD